MATAFTAAFAAASEPKAAATAAAAPALALAAAAAEVLAAAAALAATWTAAEVLAAAAATATLQVLHSPPQNCVPQSFDPTFIWLVLKGQKIQVVPPGKGWYDPGRHSRQAVAPCLA